MMTSYERVAVEDPCVSRHGRSLWRSQSRWGRIRRGRVLGNVARLAHEGSCQFELGRLALESTHGPCHHRGMDESRRVGLAELTRPECLELLATATNGHLAVTHRALPVVVPVRINFVDGKLVIASLIDDVTPLVAGSIVALETGLLEVDAMMQWSVLVQGMLTVTGDHNLLWALDRPTAAARAFHLSYEIVTGWRSAV